MGMTCAFKSTTSNNGKIYTFELGGNELVIKFDRAITLTDNDFLIDA